MVIHDLGLVISASDMTMTVNIRNCYRLKTETQLLKRMLTSCRRRMKSCEVCSWLLSLKDVQSKHQYKVYVLMRCN
jgi:hypothetical protein